jgi:tetratricopeptide (TPR) repeat protein
VLIAFMLRRSGELSYYLGDWAHSHAVYSRAASIQSQLDRHGISWYSAYPPAALGALDLAEGRIKEAKHQFALALSVAERTGDLQALVGIGCCLAELELLTRQTEEAYARLTPLLTRARAESPLHAHRLLWLVAWAQLDLGDHEGAARTLEAAPADSMRVSQLDDARVQVLLRIRERRWQEGEATLKDAIALARAMPYPYAEAKALSVYGQLHVARGELEPARKKYQAALTICGRLGEGLYRPHIEQALAEVKRE